MQRRRPVMLVILDGWGWRDDPHDNAIRQANTPNFDRLWQTGPHGFLHTSGQDVGLPEGQMGNSEVGHLNIGAGRVVVQDLPRIGAAIASGEIERAPALITFVEKLKASGGACHLIGLVSPGGVHSHQDHAVALAKILDRAKLPVWVHAITDGRDTPPQSAADDIKRLIAALPQSVRIASVCGRYYAMDRDKRWDRVEKAYKAMVDADAPRFAGAPAAIADAYAGKKFDEFMGKLLKVPHSEIKAKLDAEKAAKAKKRKAKKPSASDDHASRGREERERRDASDQQSLLQLDSVGRPVGGHVAAEARRQRRNRRE